MNEAKLAIACQKQIPEAQQELYTRYAGMLFTICIRYIGDRSMAEDVLHDGFIKIFTAIQKFQYRGEGSLEAWIIRVMVNTALEQLRSNARSQSVLMASPNEIESVGEEEEEEDVLDAIDPDTILKFIAELPDGYRTVFNLYTFEEKSHREIAQLLGIQERSSSSQLHRAKTILHKRIKDCINGSSKNFRTPLNNDQI